MYLTLKEEFWSYPFLQVNQKVCKELYTCYSRPAKEPGCKFYNPIIPYDFRPMCRIAADLKWIPLLNQGFNYI